MHTKIPLDVDLEDKLLYGLTLTRLAYLVVAMLTAFSIWSSPWSAAPIRACVASLIALVGVVIAWGRWHGRAADSWIVDAIRFAITNYRIELRHRRAKLTSRSLVQRPIDHGTIAEPLAEAA